MDTFFIIIGVSLAFVVGLCIGLHKSMEKFARNILELTKTFSWVNYFLIFFIGILIGFTIGVLK